MVGLFRLTRRLRHLLTDGGGAQRLGAGHQLFHSGVVALGRRRVDLTYTASYDAPTETVRTAILEAVAAFPQVTDEPAPTVVLSEYGASSISYLVRLWVSAADYWTVYYGMNEKVRETFAAHGVEMTYDHLNVHMIKD